MFYKLIIYIIILILIIIKDTGAYKTGEFAPPKPPRNMQTPSDTAIRFAGPHAVRVSLGEHSLQWGSDVAPDGRRKEKGDKHGLR